MPQGCLQDFARPYSKYTFGSKCGKRWCLRGPQEDLKIPLKYHQNVGSTCIYQESCALLPVQQISSSACFKGDKGKIKKGANRVPNHLANPQSFYIKNLKDHITSTPDDE